MPQLPDDPFVTNQDILDRFDGRWIGKNLNDDNTAATITQLLIDTSGPGARLKSLAIDASEELMSAAAVGARYTEPQLREYGGNLLKSIVCGLVMGAILQRRGRAVDDFDKLSASYTLARERVEELRRGERIFFNVPDVPEAGLPGTPTSDPIPGIDPPLLTQAAVRYFGYPIGGPRPYPPG